MPLAFPAKFQLFLHWEKRSREAGQRFVLEEERHGIRTLGGIRVDSARL